MAEPGTWVGGFLKAAKEILPDSLKSIVYAVILLLLFAVTAAVVLVAKRSVDQEDEWLIVGVIALLFALWISIALFWRPLRKKIQSILDAVRPGADVATAEELEKRRKRRVAVASAAAIIILAAGAFGVWAVWPSAYAFAIEMKLRYDPPQDLAYLRELERVLERNEATDAQLRSLVDELFVVGPAAPVVAPDGAVTYNSDFTQFRLDQTRPQDDVGYQILSRVQVGGLLFRPSSFSIIETHQTGSADRSGDTWRVVGSRLQNQEQAAAWVQRLTSYRHSTDLSGDASKTPLLVMADHEGGIGGALNDLSRLNVSYAHELPAAMALSVSRRRANACRAGFLAARDLRALGLNVNLAPVMDLAAEDDNQVIHDRSFGVDISTTSAMSTAYIEGMYNGGVAGVIKHYPGHSRTPAGAHAPGLETSGYDAALLDALLEPFRTALAEDSEEPQFVMSAFFRAPQLGLEPNQNIATSPKFMYEILRGREHPDQRMRSGALDRQRQRVRVESYEIQTLGFDGVLISDDLLIQSLVFAERRHLTAEQLTTRVADQAIALFDAGHDMLLIGDVRSQRDGDARIGANWQAGEEPAYLTLEEFVTVRDRMVQHIFEPGQAARRERLRESLLRIIRQKILLRESELLAPSVSGSGAVVASNAMADVHHQLWQDSMGYVFRGGLRLPHTESESAHTIVVTPFGRNAMPRSARDGRVVPRNSLRWEGTSPADVALRQSFIRESPLGAELLTRLGPQVMTLPITSNERIARCIRSSPGEAPLMTPEQTPVPPERVGPTDSEIAERIYEDLPAGTAQERRNRKRCFMEEGDAIAAAIAASHAQSVIFVVVDERTYFVTLFALTQLQRMHVSALGGEGEDAEATDEPSDTPWFGRTLVVFDWRQLLTYSDNEFGVPNRRLEDGDADVLDRVNLFFPFSGYQERSRQAAEFLLDPVNERLIASNERRRMPIRVPGSDIPFSIEDAYAPRTCRDVLADDGILRRAARY